jgi:hypothetical protein
VLLRRDLVDVVYAYSGFESKVSDDAKDRVDGFGGIEEIINK